MVQIDRLFSNGKEVPEFTIHERGLAYAELVVGLYPEALESQDAGTNGWP